MNNYQNKDRPITDKIESIRKLKTTTINKDSNNIDIKLNNLVFIDLLVYLLYDVSFKRILEISLLSKSIFKSVQQTISHQQLSIKFFPNIDHLIVFMNNDIYNDLNSSNKEPVLKKRNIQSPPRTPKYYSARNIRGEVNNRYKYKIIQYKDIENLYCTYKREFTNSGINHFKMIKQHLKTITNGDSCSSISSGNDSDSNNDSGSSDNYRNKLKHVIFVNRVWADTYNMNPTCNGFFKFNKIRLYWNDATFPCSSTGEYYDYDFRENNILFEYSFEFLKRYNPKNIDITTTSETKDYNTLDLQKINNIFNCETIKKIKFKHHETPSSFFLQSIKSSSSSSSVIKSLHLRFPNFVQEINEYINEDSVDLIKKLLNLDHYGEHDSALLGKEELVGEFLKECNISNNTTLMELIILKPVNYDYFILNDSTFLLESLIGNKTLTTLGLSAFVIRKEIKNYNFSPSLKQTKLIRKPIVESSSKTLSPLIEIPTITTLHCEFHSIITFLQHCNDNSNIKHLIVTSDEYLYNNKYYLEEFKEDSVFNDDEIQYISNFLKQNKSLQYLEIKLDQIKEKWNIFKDTDKILHFFKNYFGSKKKK
ncbi:hypothetical protein RB653_010339 [Dictyostelium firmibasis]|uniref:F-box domain-containing protein n=1 Tax=Dictyostelium firmibasis TaxID=79012 RepID=A0AAN7TTL2_9MYCE